MEKEAETCLVIEDPIDENMKKSEGTKKKAALEKEKRGEEMVSFMFDE